MANWLEKFNPRLPQNRMGRNLPANLGDTRLPFAKVQLKELPNASIIYGMASAMLFVVALYFMLFKHMWIAGFLVTLPAACLLGFALHFLKYPH